MRVYPLASPFLEENGYLVASSQGPECVIVDPGAGVHRAATERIAGLGLRPVAVLATHGHVDHLWDAGRLTDELAVPLLIHPADAYRLEDPFGTLGLGGEPSPGGGPAGLPPFLRDELLRAGLDPDSYRRPADVRPLEPGQSLELAGLRFTVLEAPGHTEGSVIYLLEGAPDGDAGTDVDGASAGDGLEGAAYTAFVGDVLFAGSIGRTDLPGGDPARMRATLRTVVWELPDETLVLPGHGPATSMRDERRQNPYLVAAASGAGGNASP